MEFKAKDFLEAMNAMEDYRGIPHERTLLALKEAFEKGMMHELNADDVIVRVDIDETKGTIRRYQIKKVVEEVEDDYLEISQEEAKEWNPKKDYQIGDECEIEMPIQEMTAGNAKFVASLFRQKIAEAEKEVLYAKYKNCIGEMMQGTVEKNEPRGALINIGGRTTVFMPKQFMIGNEEFKQGDRILLYVSNVTNTPKGAQIIVSRTDPGFLKRLFEREVHEIYDGTVVIQNIARKPGVRSKVAVYSTDPNVPASGACIGPNGTRIQSIVAELGNTKVKEKIDIINYSKNPGIYIMEALKPANILGVILNEEEKKAIAVVLNNEFSLAIGKGGVNVSLAAKLTGWHIDIKEQDEAMQAGLRYLTADELRRMDEAKEAQARYDAIIAASKEENAPEYHEEETPMMEEENEVVEEEVVEEEAVVEESPVEETSVEEKQEPAIEEEKVVVKVEETTSVRTDTKLADLERELEEEKKRNTPRQPVKKNYKKAEEKKEEPAKNNKYEKKYFNAELSEKEKDAQ